MPLPDVYHHAHHHVHPMHGYYTWRLVIDFTRRLRIKSMHWLLVFHRT